MLDRSRCGINFRFGIIFNRDIIESDISKRDIIKNYFSKILFDIYIYSPSCIYIYIYILTTYLFTTYLQDLNDRFKEEEDTRNNLFQNKKKLEQEVAGLKKDIEDLELNLQKSEQDKATKDHQIRNLNDEIAHQDELINKLNKEKKNQGEVNQKTAEELQAAEDKVNHLNKVKIKLEHTLDELEDSLEREKKSRLEL